MLRLPSYPLSKSGTTTKLKLSFPCKTLYFAFIVILLLHYFCPWYVSALESSYTKGVQYVAPKSLSFNLLCGFAAQKINFGTLQCNSLDNFAMLSSLGQGTAENYILSDSGCGGDTNPQSGMPRTAEERCINGGS